MSAQTQTQAHAFDDAHFDSLVRQLLAHCRLYVVQGRSYLAEAALRQALRQLRDPLEPHGTRPDGGSNYCLCQACEWQRGDAV